MLDVLDNDNIITAKAFEIVQKVPADEKDYRKCSLVSIYPQDTSVSILWKKLDVNKAPPGQLKEIAEDIFKLYRKRRNN